MDRKFRLYQQGDVLIFEVAEIPSDTVFIPHRQHQNVLQRGEVTGHAHRVDGFMKMYRAATKDQNSMFMDVPKRVILTHEEHTTQEILPGKYRLSRVREMDHLSREVSHVLD